ncbi:hypothetical protein CLOM_g123 [Closterium sp. NIES-68]|nr:hypothetical protein CLOM_g123 [Closterium sp. NIES-68]
MAGGMSFMDALRVAAKTKDAPCEWYGPQCAWPTNSVPEALNSSHEPVSVPSLSMPSLQPPSLQAPSPRKRRQCGPETPRKSRSESPVAADLTNAAPRTGSTDLTIETPNVGGEWPTMAEKPRASSAAQCATTSQYGTLSTPQCGAIAAAQCGATTAQCGATTATQRSPRPPRRRRDARQPPLTLRTVALAPSPEADPAKDSTPPPLRLTPPPTFSAFAPLPASAHSAAFPASPKLLVLPDSTFLPSPRIPDPRSASPRTCVTAPFEAPQIVPRRSADSPRACNTAPATPSCPRFVEPRLGRARTCVVAVDNGGTAPESAAGASAIRRTASGGLADSPAAVYTADVSPASACATTGGPDRVDCIDRVVHVDRVDRVNGNAPAWEWAEAVGMDIMLDFQPSVREKPEPGAPSPGSNSPVECEAIAGEKRERGGECDEGKRNSTPSADEKPSLREEKPSLCEEKPSLSDEKPSLWDIIQWEADMISSVCSSATTSSSLKSPRLTSSLALSASPLPSSLSASALPTTPPPTPSASKTGRLTIESKCIFEPIQEMSEGGAEMEVETGDEAGTPGEKLSREQLAAASNFLSSVQQGRDCWQGESEREAEREAERQQQQQEQEQHAPRIQKRFSASSLLDAAGNGASCALAYAHPPAHGSPRAPAGGFAQLWSEAWAEDASAELPGLAGNCAFWL